MSRCIKKDLYIIFEGITEEKFISKMEKIFSTNVNVIKRNADGAENILREYKTIKKKNYFSDIIVMYDLDSVKNVNKIINLYKEKDIKLLKKEIYFINPKFEIIFVLCKKNEAPIDNYEIHIKKLYGIENYKKKSRQIEKIISAISKEDIIKMIERIDRLMSKNDNEIRSTNYDKLFSMLFKIK